VQAPQPRVDTPQPDEESDGDVNEGPALPKDGPVQAPQPGGEKPHSDEDFNDLNIPLDELVERYKKDDCRPLIDAICNASDEELYDVLRTGGEMLNFAKRAYMDKMESAHQEELEYRLKRKQLPGEREKVPKESLEGIYR
jgi:hypothetical protein